MNKMVSPRPVGPRDVSLLHALGAFHFAFGRADTALNILELARFLDRRNRDTYITLARTYFEIGDLASAVARMDTARALSVAPLDPRDEAFEQRLRLLHDIAPGTGSAL